MIDTVPLTGRILSLLLCHQVATTDHLLELLDFGGERRQLEDRLDVLHTQDLTARHDGGWHLTDAGVAVACAQPENLGCRPDRPPRGRTALALTGLGLAFRQQHRNDFPGAPFVWETQVVHRFRDRDGSSATLQVDARLRTCHRAPAGLLARDGLVALWPEQVPQDGIAPFLLRAAAFVNGGPAGRRGPGDPWRRWYPRVPALLLLTSGRSGRDPLLGLITSAARRNSEVRLMLRSMPVGVAPLGDIARYGTAAPVWRSPTGVAKQVWMRLPFGNSENAC